MSLTRCEHSGGASRFQDNGDPIGARSSEGGSEEIFQNLLVAFQLPSPREGFPARTGAANWLRRSLLRSAFQWWTYFGLLCLAGAIDYHSCQT